MVSATLDTSVYIRALHLGGPAATLIGYARMGELRIDLSGPIMDESMRVLRGEIRMVGRDGAFHEAEAGGHFQPRHADGNPERN